MLFRFLMPKPIELSFALSFPNDSMFAPGIRNPFAFEKTDLNAVWRQSERFDVIERLEASG